MDDALIEENIKHTCKSNNVEDLVMQIQYMFVPSLENRLAECLPSRKKITISKSHWNESSQDEKVNTIVHEVAHVIVHHVHGHKVHEHGPEWRKVVENAGQIPYITSMEFKEGGQLFELTCGCSSVKVSKSRASQLNQKLMYCEACKEPVCLSIGDEKKV